MTVISIADFDLSPEIILSSDDHSQLIVLAMAGSGQTEEAESLLSELERARIVPTTSVPRDAVRMGSLVRYRTNGGDEREVVLVYPADADIDAGKVSVLTPMGTALLGLRSGQSITWLTRNGRKQVLTVLDVQAPQAEDDNGPGPSAA
ncbi:MAG: nucleoside diphosphate kinase regulator [Hyphomicrobiales bacterium]|nr:MAG: nucleoside diphosphate kinase regulator [Hyphomicrobiales bacterium]